MAIHIYNSLTKQKEEFVPLKGKAVNMYSCGVTVYDKCHIGHARSLYIFDVIRRYLKYRGYDVRFVRNITDVDDKIINKAKELNKSSDDLVTETIAAYHNDLTSLQIDQADIEPRATENIDEMIKAIEELIKLGFAYEVDGDVYYNVRQFGEYGKLSGQSVEHMQEAVRIEADAKKKDSLDFALWKRSGEGDPSWESPWGSGRPGWHIECSCMSLKHLNCETLDIHAGGRDLIFPHHENEIAQAEPLSKKPFAKYWIHHGLLTINGQKMAKSVGNFITVEDFLKEHSADQLKLFFLSSHYASPVDYTEEKLQDAKKALARFEIFTQKAAKIGEVKSDSAEAGFIADKREAFVAAMDDDFNTAKAIAVLFDLLNEANKFMDTQKDHKDFTAIVVRARETIEELGGSILGLFQDKGGDDLPDDVVALLTKRAQARQDKDYALSDQLRDQIKDKGFVVEDGPQGQSWRKL